MSSNSLVNWLNASILPGDPARREQIGLYEKFFEDGQLAEFGKTTNWFLVLEHGKPEGQAVLTFGSGGTTDSEIYTSGTYERFDAWSDSSRPHPMLYDEWVKKWIKSIWSAAEKSHAEQLQAMETKAKIAKLGRRAVIKSVK